MESDHKPTHRHSGHLAFEGEQLVKMVDFPFDEIDGVLAVAPQDALTAAGELMRELFHFCYDTSQNNRRTQFQIATARFAVIVSGLRPEILSDQTRTEIAEALGVTKAALSKISVNFEQRFNFKSARTRSAAARAAMSKAAMGHAPTNVRRKPRGQVEPPPPPVKGIY